MTISYPLALPVPQFSKIRFGARAAVGITQSPFTFAQQAQAHQGQTLRAEVSYPPLERADAEDIVGFLLALNGREGTFLMGDSSPAGAAPRGTWAGGSPVVDGGGQTGLTLNIRGLAAGANGKRGDWLQLGTGANAHLHKLTADFTMTGSPGYATLDIWPRLRASPGNGDAIVIASAQGLWRLADNETSWDIGEAQIYGIAFSCMEALGV